VDDVSLSPGNVVTLDTWTAVVAINYSTWRDVLVRGRSAELSLNANVELPIGQEPLLPVERENVWRIVGAVALPWGDSAKIPISITLTSDPNSLTEEKFVTGHIGLTYDFGALKTFLKP
jgi:hypothetical protein